VLETSSSCGRGGDLTQPMAPSNKEQPLIQKKHISRLPNSNSKKTRALLKNDLNTKGNIQQFIYEKKGKFFLIRKNYNKKMVNFKKRSWESGDYINSELLRSLTLPGAESAQMHAYDSFSSILR